ncbi:MAG: helix-hairpin-helix domain-containing protein [Synergistota bacterium]|nr:helix-hairpin-helix domain-containing protein [Synergistota bacterium]
MKLKEQGRGLLFLGGGLVCFVLAALLVAGFAGKWMIGGSGVVAGPAPESLEKNAETAVSLSSPGNGDPQDPVEWVVYITGAVMRPGVYRIDEGSRVYSLVGRAGGLTDEADAEAFNMAAPLSDGVHVHVPRKGETPAPKEALSAVMIQTPVSGKIDINRADERQLQDLPGVGPKTAAAILEYRSKQGPFRSPEDLLRVSGIGPAKLEGLRDCIVIR